MHQTLIDGLQPGELAIVTSGVTVLVLHFAASARATVRAIRGRRVPCHP